MRQLIAIIALLSAACLRAQTVEDWQNDSLPLRPLFARLSFGSSLKMDEQLLFDKRLTALDSIRIDARLFGCSDQPHSSGFLLHNRWSTNKDLQIETEDNGNSLYTGNVTAGYVRTLRRSGKVSVGAEFQSDRFNYMRMSELVLEPQQENPNTAVENDKGGEQNDIAACVNARLDDLKLGQFTLSAEGSYIYATKRLRLDDAGRYAGHEAKLTADVTYDINEAWTAGVDAGIKQTYYSPGKLKGVFEADLTPYARWHTDKIDAQFGVFVGFPFCVAPDCHFTYHIDRRNDISINVEGSDNETSLRTFNAISPYWQASFMADKIEMYSSFDQVHPNIGYRYHHMGLDIEAKAGYTYTIGAPILLGMGVNSHRHIVHEIDFGLKHRIYADLNVRYNLMNRIEVALLNQFNYSRNIVGLQDVLDGQDMTFNVPEHVLPVINLDWTATVHLTKGIHFIANGILRTYQKVEGDDVYQRPTQFSVNATLRINFGKKLPFTIYATGTNIFKGVYDNYYGYRAPGPCALLGVTFSL